ncbi:type IV secretion system protein [Luteococcus sp. H138]|uniref:type IV secretion system protein n=1 Tax=unclassified Luteococcus TaxID=2639923 RepID=UPI00313E5AE8
MDQLLIEMLNALGDGAQGQVGGLLQSPEDYNPALYAAAQAIHNGAVKPVTAIVLAIMSVLMLAEISARVDGDRELGVKMVAAAMFKIALTIIVVQNAMLVLEAINAVTTSIAQAVDKTAIATPEASSVRLGDQLADKVKDAGTVKQLGLLLVVFLPWLVAETVGVVGTVLVFVRFLQLYMLTAFSSLPVAFFGHPDTKSMAIGYLKRYATTALQGVMLLLAFKLYQALMSGWLTGNVHYDNGDIFKFMVTSFGHLLVGPLVLGFLLVGTSGLAKAIVGEG